MTDTSHKRMTILGAVVAFMFAALITRLWFLQALAAEQYQERAQSNRVRLVPLPAARGEIVDRTGRPLVSNDQTSVITVDRQEVDDEDALLTRLSDLLGAPKRVLRTRLNDADFFPYQPVPIFYRAPENALLYIAENREDFPGVDYDFVALRSYEYGNLAAHLLGYLGEVTELELADPTYANHLPGERVGRTGVEQQYERYLRGKNGWLKLEVDSTGKVLGRLGRDRPRPGNDVVLALDVRIQRAAEKALAEGIGAADEAVPEEGLEEAPAGAVVVLEPSTGHVLAAASAPTYDPRLFLEPLRRERYAQLFNHPKANTPLQNRVIAGLYPAASTFKPFVASAAIDAGYATTNGFYPCPGVFEWEDQQFANWTSVNQPPMTLTEALTQSCDTVFYKFGAEFWKDRDARGELFQQHLRRWGFARLTGVDLPGEAIGRVPDEDWLLEMHETLPRAFPYDQWLPGYDINLSIGQGDLLVTPLQLATAFAAIANGGTLYRPQVALRIEGPRNEMIEEFEPQPQPNARVPSDPRTLAFLRQALTGVTSAPSGTATAAFSGFPLHRYPVAGKTGTAQHSGGEVDHAWFAAIAPADDPQYVVVVIAEEAGYGGAVAAPIARRILEGIFALPESEFRLGAAAD